MAEAERPARRAPRRRRNDDGPETTPDPIEIAMQAVATGADRHSSARTVLEKHAKLIDIQCRREREEWHVLRIQRLIRWLLLLTVAALLLGAAAMLWNASRSNSLVIEPFGVPPALAQRGLTGKVVSARVLDQLAELQRETESMRGEKSYANNWQDDIQLDIPQTGISLGEAWRTVKSWLGEEMRIGGEVVQTAGGLSITTRAGAVSGGTVEGPEADTDRLFREAARAIYKATQPYRYAISLPPERVAEREQVLLGLTGDPSDTERKWAYSGLSVSARERGDYVRARAMALRALAIDPELLPGLGNLAHAEGALGHVQAMLDVSARLERLYRRGALEGYDPRVAGLNRVNGNAVAAERLGDAVAVLENARALQNAGASTFSGTALYITTVAALITRNYPAAGATASRFIATDDEDAAAGATLAARVALERAVDHGDRAAATAAVGAFLRAAEAGLAPTHAPARVADTIARSYLPIASIAYARLGMAREAAALAAELPADCYDCVRAAGWAALARGDRAEAARRFAEAVRQAPSVPMAYADQGEMLLRAGDPRGAAARFAAAHERGPRWADPLKLWGDALVRQSDFEGAERRYREAEERAPRWARLRMARAQALWRLGRRDEARDELRAAAGMDLGAADRGRLARMMAVAQGRGV